MANLCENEAVITGSSTVIDSVIKKLFAKAVPESCCCSDGTEADWQCYAAELSGCWDGVPFFDAALDGFRTKESGGEMCLSFSFGTKWQPPFDLFERLSAEETEASIVLTCMDTDFGDEYADYCPGNGEDCGFFGRFEFRGGLRFACEQTEALFDEIRALFVHDDEDGDEDL